MTGRKPRERKARAQPEPRLLVFVYGTLLAGERNHHLLDRSQLVASTKTRPVYTLHDLGLFPGLVAGGAHAVVGEVYEIDEPTLARLDRLEGHPDFYCRASISLDNGMEAEVYLLPPRHAAPHPIIVSGDWRQR